MIQSTSGDVEARKQELWERVLKHRGFAFGAEKILAEADKLSAPEICNPLRMTQAKSQTIFCKRPK